MMLLDRMSAAASLVAKQPVLVCSSREVWLASGGGVGPGGSAFGVRSVVLQGVDHSNVATAVREPY